MPGIAEPCVSCAYRLASLDEAADLLRSVILTAHMRRTPGGTLIEARLDDAQILRLCLWEEGCADCECGESMGDGNEPDAQYVTSG